MQLTQIESTVISDQTHLCVHRLVFKRQMHLHTTWKQLPGKGVNEGLAVVVVLACHHPLCII